MQPQSSWFRGRTTAWTKALRAKTSYLYALGTVFARWKNVQLRVRVDERRRTTGAGVACRLHGSVPLGHLDQAAAGAVASGADVRPCGDEPIDDSCIVARSRSPMGVPPE